MSPWFLSERGGERGRGLTNPFVNPERDVELEAARGSAGFVCEAFFGMEPYAEGKLPRIVLVEGSAPTAA